MALSYQNLHHYFMRQKEASVDLSPVYE